MQVRLDGGFANHLRFYITGALIACHKQVDLTITHNIIPNDPLPQRNDTRRSLLHGGIMKNGWKNKCIHLDENLNPFLRGTQVTTFFTDAILYKYRDFIRDNIINLDFCVDKRIELKNTDVVLSLRTGIGQNEVAPNVFTNIITIPVTYYTDILDANTFTTIYICADNFNSNHVRELMSRYNNIHLLDTFNTLEQFRVLLSTPCLISSNSTFPMSAGIFSTHAIRIFYPRFKNSGCIYPIYHNLDIHDCKQRYYTSDTRVLYIDIA